MSVSQLSPERIAEYKRAFTAFDQDGNGKITASELSQAFESLGRHYTQAEIQTQLKTVDANQNGTLEFQEFLELVVLLKQHDVSEVREAFKRYDKDGNGRISKKELKEMMLSLGEKLSDAQIDEMIREADANGNGEIELEEFIKIMG
ncbi:calmodulin-like protein [Pluteus cervinus]|uniref:Calmodulin-like protein n=1 Tax=Pluteus cervinus TaxID=181527 RepID=A0ACD3AS04_9AGAR|nr:calmodulin-like protein [Pluteus cervinus]